MAIATETWNQVKFARRLLEWTSLFSLFQIKSFRDLFGTAVIFPVWALTRAQTRSAGEDSFFSGPAQENLLELLRNVCFLDKQTNQFNSFF